jgi:hypothetical protein
VPSPRKKNSDTTWVQMALIEILGTAYLYVGNYAKVEIMFGNLHTAFEIGFGREHLRTIDCLEDLAKATATQEDYEKAEKVYA